MRSDIERLVKRLLRNREIDPVTGCWNWTGWIRKDGYGQIIFRGRQIKPHRLMAWLCLGLVLEDKSSSNYVLHKCDNRRCFNPVHLTIGSQSRNNSEAFDLGKLCRNGYHVLTMENTDYYRGGRRCLDCVDIRDANRDRSVHVS